jgi:hypothetical protein
MLKLFNSDISKFNLFKFNECLQIIQISEMSTNFFCQILKKWANLSFFVYISISF